MREVLGMARSHFIVSLLDAFSLSHGLTFPPGMMKTQIRTHGQWTTSSCRTFRTSPIAASMIPTYHFTASLRTICVSFQKSTHCKSIDQN